MNWLKQEWSACKDFYFKHLHTWSVIVGIVFFLCGILTAVVLLTNKEILTQGYAWLMSIFEEKGLDVETITAMDLFCNNTIACLYDIALGYIPFFFLGVLSLVLNGTSIGIITAVYVQEQMSMMLLLAGLIPHGIFELPAIFISLAISFKTCYLMSTKITGKNESWDIKEYSMNVLRTFVFIILPMLILAAVIEAYITPLCMSLFM